MAKTQKQDMVSLFEQMEAKPLTLPEAVNRFLMRAETAAIDADRAEFVAMAAKHFDVTPDEVDRMVGAQGDKRIEALTRHADRIKSLLAAHK
jgi:hypothetical protein